jgi:hypothetical protein
LGNSDRFKQTAARIGYYEGAYCEGCALIFMPAITRGVMLFLNITNNPLVNDIKNAFV